MLPVVRTGSMVPLTVGGRLASLFESLLNDDFFGQEVSKKSGWTSFPLAMWEDEQNVYVEVDAPGMSEKDIELSVHQGNLIIRGERKFERKQGGYDTRVYGNFAQSVSLPSQVDADKVDAKLVGGVLHIKFPKSEVAKPRKITVKSE